MLEVLVANIPNLNIPTEEVSESSSSQLNNSSKPISSITSPNKFEILNSQYELEPQDCLAECSYEVGTSQKQMGKSKKQTTSDNSKKSAKGKQSKKSQSQTNN
ncbi:hypothetical protein MA16_Dca017983 [Dendrobium catenatum]|uniref:Uncharacterized protein n=1 Tax=Dendrobium catenatum TaxID=906689 RepID=A0A2I0W277_9ASPA|nr:hypothetical protein MA16_Dca017983 [Dendrobium catenatum]